MSETPPDDFSWLPPILAEMAQVAGLDAALAIAKVKGGARCTFPVRAPDGHWLVSVVGREKANLLCRHFATRSGAEMLIARGVDGLKKRRYYELRAERVSVEGAARLCGAHLRTCRKWEKDKGAKAQAQARVRRAGTSQLDMIDWLESIDPPPQRRAGRAF